MAGLAAHRMVSALTLVAVLGIPGISVTVPRFLDSLTALWMQVGCGLDPSGSCSPATEPQAPSEGTDVGCGLDPDGRCLPDG